MTQPNIFFYTLNKLQSNWEYTTKTVINNKEY